MKIRKSITVVALLTAFLGASVASLAKEVRAPAADEARTVYEAQFNRTDLEHQF
ncbi:MAG: hypothetical protein HY900_28055 [Deltaproteobacteria bacterium]|nr:hypothetical protein [Deltaproteobacteria bacterium]